MGIKRYTKAEIKIHNEPQKIKEVYFAPGNTPQFKYKRKTSVWEILKNSYDDFIDLLVTARFVGFLIPVILIATGIILLHKELWPEVEQQIKESEGYYNQGSTPLVDVDYIQSRQLYLSTLGANYFKDLSDNALSQHVLREDPISKNYSGNFKLSIPSIGLNNLPVKANVKSGDSNEYEEVLKTHIAHMDGTGLPISDINNNSVLYGHSARGDYFDQTQDVAGAFSRLQKLQIGDKITIEMEGKTYTYKVSKTKIVQPDDISIVTGVPNERTLTLFTCFPNGNPAKRFVVVAKPE